MRRMFSEKQIKELVVQATQELKNKVEELEKDKPFAYGKSEVQDDNSIIIFIYYNRKYIPSTLHFNFDTTNDTNIDFNINISDSKIEYNYPTTTNYSLTDNSSNADDYSIGIDEVNLDEEGYIAVYFSYTEGSNHFVQEDNRDNISLTNIALMPFIFDN